MAAGISMGTTIADVSPHIVYTMVDYTMYHNVYTFRITSDFELWSRRVGVRKSNCVQRGGEWVEHLSALIFEFSTISYYFALFRPIQFYSVLFHSLREKLSASAERPMSFLAMLLSSNRNSPKLFSELCEDAASPLYGLHTLYFRV